MLAWALWPPQAAICWGCWAPKYRPQILWSYKTPSTPSWSWNFWWCVYFIHPCFPKAITVFWFFSLTQPVEGLFYCEKRLFLNGMIWCKFFMGLNRKKNTIASFVFWVSFFWCSICGINDLNCTVHFILWVSMILLIALIMFY